MLAMTAHSQKKYNSFLRAPYRSTSLRTRGPPCKALKAPNKVPEESEKLNEFIVPSPRQSKPFAEVLMQRVLDTGDDILLHARRLFDKGMPSKGSIMTGADGKRRYMSNKPVLLVLGYGWAAHAFSKGPADTLASAMLLPIPHPPVYKQVVDMEAYDVVVISPRNHFIFTPMLPSSAVGSVEFRSLLEPIHSANPFLRYFEAECTDLNTESRAAVCRAVNRTHPNVDPTIFEVNYDKVFIAVGEQPATFGTPGVREYCFFMKEVTDSVALRKRLSEQFEMAAFAESDLDKFAVLRFVVVGGGPTGVEFAGTLSDFIFREVKHVYPKLAQYVEVVLVQAAPTILPVFTGSLQKRAVDNLETQEVRVLTNVTVRPPPSSCSNSDTHVFPYLESKHPGAVTEVREKKIWLSDGNVLPYGVCLWSTGNSSLPLTRDLVAQIPEQQALATGKRPTGFKLAVDDHLRIIGADGAFAAGDCSVMVRGSMPPTAQVAGQQGAYVARTINRSDQIGKGGFDSGSEAPYRVQGNIKKFEHEFEFLSLGIMAYIGRNRCALLGLARAQCTGTL